MHYFEDKCRPKLAATTSTESTSFAAAVSICQSYNGGTSSLKGAKIQALEDCSNSMNIPDEYAAYHGDFIPILELFR